MDHILKLAEQVAERLEKAAETWAAGKGDSRRESKSSVRKVSPPFFSSINRRVLTSMQEDIDQE